jgi:pimeloyl-ACP methyl ester carboxylesterase
VSYKEFDITLRSHRLHAQRYGSPSAPLVLGVHGLSGNMKTFDFLGERLGSDAVQLVALDLRGRGRSETTPPGTYGWDNHALDVLAVADALGVERFSIIGHSMGGSVAMKAAELDGSRLDAIVLLDIAGRVDPGIGPVIASVIDRIGTEIRSFEERVDHAAVTEDRRYTATQDPYDRWKHLTMPTLLLRATRELVPGAGHVVPAADRDRFLREVRHGVVTEIDANHQTITTHPQTATATAAFLAAALSPG